MKTLILTVAFVFASLGMGTVTHAEDGGCCGKPCCEPGAACCD